MFFVQMIEASLLKECFLPQFRLWRPCWIPEGDSRMFLVSRAVQRLVPEQLQGALKISMACVLMEDEDIWLLNKNGLGVQNDLGYLYM